MSLTMKPSLHPLFAYDLHSNGAPVGWLRTGRVGLFGFYSEQQAIAAGREAARVLGEWFTTRWHGVPIAWPHDAPELPILHHDVVVGRVLRAGDPELSHGALHGIEVCLPTETWTALLIEVGQRLHSAIVTSGVELQSSRVHERAS